jgi:predicted HTH transcriptional regulator
VREEGLLGHRMVYNWPETTFAELLTNAVLHKEYDKKQYVGVYVYRDTLSFINHNRPLPPVTIEDLNNEVEFRDRNYLNPEIKEMFHALGLIESYGSGIRRAKHAMAYNGNPPLLFEPLNDTDDYTMVTCPINEEFAYIRDHEDEATRKTSEKTTANAQDTTQEPASTTKETTPKKDNTSEKTSEKILHYLRSNPKASAKDMAVILGLSQRAIEYQLRRLRQAGCIRRDGPAKGGQWIVMSKEQHDG